MGGNAQVPDSMDEGVENIYDVDGASELGTTAKIQSMGRPKHKFLEKTRKADDPQKESNEDDLNILSDAGFPSFQEFYHSKTAQHAPFARHYEQDCAVQ